MSPGGCSLRLESGSLMHRICIRAHQLFIHYGASPLPQFLFACVYDCNVFFFPSSLAEFQEQLGKEGSKELPLGMVEVFFTA